MLVTPPAEQVGQAKQHLEIGENQDIAPSPVSRSAMAPSRTATFSSSGTLLHSLLPNVLRQELPTAFFATTHANNRVACVHQGGRSLHGLCEGRNANQCLRRHKLIGETIQEATHQYNVLMVCDLRVSLLGFGAQGGQPATVGTRVPSQEYCVHVHHVLYASKQFNA